MFSHLLLLGALVSQPAGDVKQALAAVGQVLAGEEEIQGDVQTKTEGSGVVVGPKGIVVTNYHVVSDGSRVYPAIFFNLVDPTQPYAPPDPSRLYRTEILMKDVKADLVLLRIVADNEGNPISSDQSFNAITLGSSRSLSFLDDIFMVGFPKAGGSSVTINRGQVSGKDELEDWIKTDAQVTHGNSGGAAIDRQGRLIGIPTKGRPDVQLIDTDGDGFPDTNVTFGSVGLIRPVEIVGRMLKQLQSHDDDAVIQAVETTRLQIKGLVTNRSGVSVPEALVGLLKEGSREASVKNLLTHARTDANGVFLFPAAIPPGRYTIRARAPNHEIFTEELELTPQNKNLVIQLRPIPEEN